MENKGIDFASIPRTAIKFITSPVLFYREMPKKGGFVEPLVFTVVMAVIGGLIHVVASLLGLDRVSGVATSVSSMIILPIVIVIAGFIGAAIYFVIWKVMDSQEDYETAYRCTAYASAFSPILAIIGLIPYAGIVITMLIWVYLIVTASVEVHHIPSGKAWLVFGILGAIMIVAGMSSEMAAKKINRFYGGYLQADAGRGERGGKVTAADNAAPGRCRAAGNSGAGIGKPATRRDYKADGSPDEQLAP